MEENIVAALAKVLLPELQSQAGRAYGIGYGLKHDATGTPTTTGMLHGPGGILSWPGVDPAVFHTVVGNRGILDQLPTLPSLYTNPTYAIVTGVRADTGSEKTNVCDNAPSAGPMKTCYLTSVFGRYERATVELELNRLGQLNDRADPMDLTLVGSPIGNAGIFAAGPMNPSMSGDVLRNEITRRFWERNISFHRILNRQLWIGDPVNNSAGGGYKEMTGIDQLINTGHVDALTQTSCPSLDSDLKDFNYLDIATHGDDLVDALAYMYHYVRDLAERTGMMPVRWVFAMRPELFWEITKVWPCNYLTYQCEPSLGTNASVVVNGSDQVRMRDEMRAGSYLLIEGERIQVIVDDGIAEDTSTTNANVGEGCVSSDIYLIPMSVVGGRASLYLEYFQYSNPALEDALGNMIIGRIEGAFITWPRQTNLCVVWQSKIEPRLVLRTPWLAGRLQNVVSCPLQHPREPFPTDNYFVDGGVYQPRSGPSYYALWKD